MSTLKKQIPAQTGKITLAMLKGKPVTTSVPSIRFHTSGEELEEFYSSDTDVTPSEDLEDDVKISHDETPVSLGDKNTDNSKRESSPIKDVFSRLGKRSTSVDVGINNYENSPGVSTDRWRIFSEIKGKLTKTVEEKISEIKSGSKANETEKKEKNEARTGLLSKFHSSKDNSSISDSEDVSVSESSASKFADIEMSSNGTEDETASQGSDIIGSLDTDKMKNTHTENQNECSDSSPKRNVIRNRFKSLSKHKDHYLSTAMKNPKSQDRNLKILYKNSKTHNENVIINDPDIESGVEISEDFRFLPSTNLAEVADVIPNILLNSDEIITPSSQRNLSNLKTEDQLQLSKGSFNNFCSNFRCIIIVIILNIFYTVVPISPFFKGFLMGTSLSMTFCWILYKFYLWLNKSPELHILTQKSSDLKQMSILEILAVKEYQPIYKFEGWINEYPNVYDANTYHISATRSVWVCLEGSRLRISSGRGIRVSKRAMWNEPTIAPGKIPFTHHRVYSMKEAKIKLLPEGLIKKRFWSKKYPICIEFNKGSKYIDKTVLNNKEDSDQTISTALSDKKMKKDENNINVGVNTETTNIVSNDTSNINIDNDDNPNLSASSSVLDLAENDEDSFNQNDINPAYATAILTSEFEIDDIDNSITEISSSGHNTNCDTIDIKDTLPHETSRVYLFARTDREKEEWFSRFVAAVHYSDQQSFVPVVSLHSESDLSSAQSADDTPEPSEPIQSADHLNKKNVDFENKSITEPLIDNINEKESIGKTELSAEMEKYLRFMNKLTQNKSLKKEELIESDRNVVSEDLCDISTDIIWVNTLIGRILYDTMQEPIWINTLQQRIQRKLSSIKLPYFLEELIISELELGTTVPVIQRTSRPVIDARGLWIDLDITYEGSVRGTLETKFNLLKLKRLAGNVESEDKLGYEAGIKIIPSRDPIYDSDLDDSPESSSEDEIAPAPSWFISTGCSEHTNTGSQSPQSTGSNATGKKILRMVDKIAASKYFQQAAEFKYIKRAMEGVSRTELKLYVELQGLTGTLAINIPPPPSHRIWIGFRTNPKICLIAYPVVGETSLNFNQISIWIQKKLIQEFQKILVLPNMEDFVIPFMNQKLPD